MISSIVLKTEQKLNKWLGPSIEPGSNHRSYNFSLSFLLLLTKQYFKAIKQTHIVVSKTFKKKIKQNKTKPSKWYKS